MATLRYTEDSGEPGTVEVSKESPIAVIGRNPDCQIKTTNPSVSRRHGEIRLQAGFFVLKDLGSSNGTFLNDGEIKKPVILQEGDVFKCGDFTVEFAEDSVAAAPKPAARPARGPKTSEQPRTVPEKPAVAPAPSRARAEAKPAPVKAEPAPAPAPAPQASVDTAELEARAEALEAKIKEKEEAAGKLSEEKSKLREDRTKLEGVVQTLEAQSEQLSADLREQDKLIGELENRLERREMEIENHLEKQKELREQIAHQTDQIGDVRGDLRERDQEIEQAGYKVEELNEKCDASQSTIAEQADEIADYKAELSQKQRLNEELQKQLDIMTYDLQSAQEQLDDVSQTSSGAGAEVNALQRKLKHLQEIVDEKEVKVDDLTAEVEAYKEEIEGLRQDEGEEGGGGSKGADAQLQERIDELEEQLAESRMASNKNAPTGQLNELKRANRDLRHRIEELEGAGGGGEAAPAGGGRELRSLKRDLRELQDENELLQQRIAKMGKRGGGGEAGDSEAGDALKRENRELRRKLRELEGAAGDGGLSPEFEGLLESMNEIVSAWASDFDSAAYNASELKRLVEMLDRVDLGGLDSRDRRKLESVIRDVEPRETLDSLEDMLNQCLERTKELKSSLRSVRS